MYTRSVLKNVLLVLLILPLLAPGAKTLWATDPKDGATVAESPKQVRCAFSPADYEVDQCTLTVCDSNGKEVDLKDVRRDKGSQAELIVSVSVPTLPPGKYRASWTVACATWADSDHFDFTVAGR
jgi:methionine-rich copper-binding protein CopC